ncbi:MAG: cation-binding protein [Halieaceae bacterium]|jgi:hemerythrin-like domain-containing protein|nr:cation-binding protein [Halieaceae bacterium]
MHAKKKRPANTRTAGARRPGKRPQPKKIEQPIMASLRAEHRYIARVLQLFDEQIESIATGQLVDPCVAYEIMDYMVIWPDRYHHPREDLIYSRAAEIDAQAADNVDSLQREHEVLAKNGRAVLANIERWRAGEDDGTALVKGGRAYVKDMYNHIDSEENLVFPQVESILTAADWRELAEEDRLRPIADPLFGTRVDREFRNLARKLRRKLRREVERGALAEWIGIEAVMESLDVLSMAYDRAKHTSGDHLHSVWDDSWDILGESPVRGLLRCGLNNTRLGFSLVDDIVVISRDSMADLSKINQERKDRMRLIDQASG